MLTAAERDHTEHDRDPAAGWLAVGALSLLLASEAALSLPDETAEAVHVADFYHDHVVAILLLQIAGLGASVLLGAYMWRLRSVDRIVGGTGVALAVASVVPGALTAVVALVADPTAPAAAGRLNRWQPRGDDLLFAMVALFAIIVMVRLGRTHHVLGIAAAITALACLTRLLLEAANHSRGALETVAPLCFLLLVAIMGAMSFRGLYAPRQLSTRLRHEAQADN